MTEADKEAKSFYDVHDQFKYDKKRLQTDKLYMSEKQAEFYDRCALAFQYMDDANPKMAWRVRRCVHADMRWLPKGKLLFVGAGNCRAANVFVEAGYEVTATDISKNMLEVGLKHAKIPFVTMWQNAELPFPFITGQFDASYSSCVINHIVDWDNYITEKVRCIKRGGVIVERMPNVDNWEFWKGQGSLYEGVEILATRCNPNNMRELLAKHNLNGKVWTEEHVEPYAYETEQAYVKAVDAEKDDGLGIYTVLKVTA